MTVTATISQSITHGIELGTLGYGGTLTITAAGTILGTKYAIYSPYSVSSVNILNDGKLNANEVAVYLSNGGTLANAGGIAGASLAWH